ncbi:hypothetical protein EJB05_42075 [Eragrostis curvula]|uniref:Uncharacterized protein n=1 Tax=Eragrostis curvula TaxID=38414 RepID=A0A5J9TBE7_9POAL|nr:hypothetical protein EJB05_42075 [Eragrostis curvula]
MYQANQATEGTSRRASRDSNQLRSLGCGFCRAGRAVPAPLVARTEEPTRC